uniref:EXPERA domain-containing protein n=1 Tax=Oryza punctata TaxID=4537 RepID=A0A0E0LC46_ORYPU
MCWWAFTGLTHIMEGTYAFAPKFFSNQNPSFFDEGKSTAKATPDMSPETLQLLQLKQLQPCWKALHHYFLCMLFVCLVYFITAYLGGYNFWASPFYFRAYFIGANSLWVVIPTLIAIRSWKKIFAAIEFEKVKSKYA